MSKSSGKRTSEEIGMEVIGAMDREFHEQSDRVVAIVGAAYLDSTLDSLLRAVRLSPRTRRLRFFPSTPGHPGRSTTVGHLGTATGSGGTELRP